MVNMRGILLLACAGLALGQEFEVVSVKPNNSGSGSSSTRSDQGRLTAENVSLRSLVTMAYGMKDYQVEAADWLRDVKFNIGAKFSEELPHNTDKYNLALHAMMQKMLVERFKIAVHRSTKTFSVYGLVIGKNGIKFKQVPDIDSHNQHSSNTHYEGLCVSMANFAEFLSHRVELPVLDMTGLKGYYDLKLNWDPEPKADSPDLPAGISLPIALQDQLGLKLEARKAPIEILIVDRIRKVPTEN